MLDPLGNPDRFAEETAQVATIGCFVVATRLILYQALAGRDPVSGGVFKLDALDIGRATSDPTRVLKDLENLYDHARRRTGDFELQFKSTQVDTIVFVDNEPYGEVGALWGKLIDVIKSAHWTGPATYIPGLYESLLDDEHRHVMGVHYTPDPVAEIISAYAIRSPADTVLDPASGAGTFVTMCYERKRALGATHEEALREVNAIELAEFAASLTGLNLTLADTAAKSAYPQVFRTDFFSTYPGLPSQLTLPHIGNLNFPKNVDCVVGNPPYIRFENRTPRERQEVFNLLHKYRAATRISYPDFTGKADIWAFFVAGAHMYLKDGGRLGFVLSWSLLSSEYGDAVISFLGRYFVVDAIIDSKAERWFAAKQNTVLLLARRAELPNTTSDPKNPSIPDDHLVKFVRIKQPLEQILDMEQPRGKQAEDLIDEILSLAEDVGDDVRWDVRVFKQKHLTARVVSPSAK